MKKLRERYDALNKKVSMDSPGIKKTDIRISLKFVDAKLRAIAILMRDLEDTPDHLRFSLTQSLLEKAIYEVDTDLTDIERTSHDASLV